MSIRALFNYKMFMQPLNFKALYFLMDNNKASEEALYTQVNINKVSKS